MEWTRRNVLAAGVIGGVGLSAGLIGSRARAHDEEEPEGPTTPTTPTTPDAVRVQIVLFDGFEILDGLGPFDVLSISSKAGSGFQTTLVTPNGATEVVALDGVTVKTTGAYDPSADITIVPGAPALWRSGEIPEGLEAVLQAAREPGRVLASVCTGAVYLARAGWLNGRNANTHKNAQQTIVDLGANLIVARVVDDGDLLSSAGVTSGIDLAIYLVERYYGPQLAFATEQIVEHERRGTVWRKPNT
ncbi:MAG: DJ-1/PfpI family protein [Polyangiales bacterium]